MEWAWEWEWEWAWEWAETYRNGVVRDAPGLADRRISHVCRVAKDKYCSDTEYGEWRHCGSNQAELAHGYDHHLHEIVEIHEQLLIDSLHVGGKAREDPP